MKMNSDRPLKIVHTLLVVLFVAASIIHILLSFGFLEQSRKASYVCTLIESELSICIVLLSLYYTIATRQQDKSSEPEDKAWNFICSLVVLTVGETALVLPIYLVLQSQADHIDDERQLLRTILAS